MVVLSGVVYYQMVEQQTACYGNQGGGVMVAPEPLLKILEHCHDKPGAGHMGMNKTTERVKRYAIWYKMLDSCLVYDERSCSVCIPKKTQKKQRLIRCDVMQDRH